MKAVSRSLLDLPLEGGQWEGKGYTPLNKASPVFEGLGCYDMAVPGALDNFFDQFCVAPQQREIISKYSKAILELGMDMGRKLLIGLEAGHNETGENITIDPMPGSLVVNLGDLDEIWSIGKLWSVKHRVQCYEGSVRLSIALFVLGPKDGALGAPEELVDSEHPRLYNLMNFEDYRMLRITTRSPTGAIEHLRIKS
ncbi:2-oxoglutarate-dependent dioxygenase DAO-like [Actinidia eriantha]|uniref:2-oxoglutarate-dependent dioxygenase DAO-like n=1 Tax=Actinidia eriantha TaxID=165200 RepID=UPI00258D90DA|nr:2-oxoglutarate-dependent dioxygenase DAO-like [Actinidia eriantha]